MKQMDVSVAPTEGPCEPDFAGVLRETLAGAVVIIDAQRRVAGFNYRAETLLRLKASQVLGKPLEVLPAQLSRFLADVLAGEAPLTDRKLVLTTPHGHKLLVHAALTSIHAPDGKTAGVGVVLNDLASAKNWEANLRLLDRLHSVGTLSASMAHEVKNAFVAVKTFVDLLLEQNKQAELAEVVRAEMNRIDAILSQMRKLSGPVQPQFSEVRLHSVLDPLLVLVQHLLEEKKIKVARSLAASQDLLQGDPDQLEQAFINLFFNALDAMQPHGKLTVSTEMLPSGAHAAGLPERRDRRLVRLAIADNGSGISPENIGRLFEPFFTTKPDGTGLGLAITRRIIEEHHGAITVQSELNKGTTFSLTLPAANAPA